MLSLSCHSISSLDQRARVPRRRRCLGPHESALANLRLSTTRGLGHATESQQQQQRRRLAKSAVHTAGIKERCDNNIIIIAFEGGPSKPLGSIADEARRTRSAWSDSVRRASRRAVPNARCNHLGKQNKNRNGEMQRGIAPPQLSTPEPAFAFRWLCRSRAAGGGGGGGGWRRGRGCGGRKGNLLETF
ncbi:unnamed protein product [Lampetra fluviatilis]